MRLLVRHSFFFVTALLLIGRAAIPHRLIEDDVYEGYYMPKGALVFANTWSIMHDEKMYPDPFTFNPERYNAAASEKGLNPDPAQFAFGYGRR